MRIALLCTEKLPVPPIRGGAIQTYIAGVLPYLAKRHQVTVVCRSDPALSPRELKEGVRYVRVSAEGGPEAYCQRVAAFLATERWDRVELFNRPAFVGPVAAAARGAPLILSLHNEMLRPERMELEAGRACLQQVQRVVTISDFIKEGIVRLYPEHAGRLRTIRSGVDLKRFRPGVHPQAGALREKHQLGDRPVILSVGRLSPRKGIHLVLQAMEAVRRTHPEAVLLHVGSRWYGSNDEDEYVRSVWRQAARLGDAVRLAGYVPYDQIDGYFGLATLFVNASQWEEPLARVHYEAMAAGLPIITTDRGGNAEVVEEGINGLFARPFDQVEGFAEAISLLLKDPALGRSMGEQGRKLAVRHYGWKRVARELLEVLEG